MIKSKDVKNNTIINNPSFLNNIILITEGIAVGFFTGIIGAGGGFLIIPALVLFTGLDMKAAIGSSLFIIFIKSFFGFVGDYQSGVTIDINILLGVLSFTSIGMITGIILSKKTKSSILKQCFGWFILFAGFLIIIKEILL
jgi:uncharacterized membrane protein YfcA